MIKDNSQNTIVSCDIDVEKLCISICDAVEKYYNEKEEKGFEENSTLIINIKEKVIKPID